MFVSTLFKSLFRIYRVRIVIRAVTRATDLQPTITLHILKKKILSAECTLGREIPLTRGRQAVTADYLPPSNKARSNLRLAL